MADTSPLLASLLLGQKRRVDPLEAQRAFGQRLIVQGSSTEPLKSGNPLEGLARALQAGVGGYFAGQADRAEEAKGQKQIEALGKISSANNQAELTAAIKGSEIDPDLAGPLMAQLLQQKQGQFQRTTSADSIFPQAGQGNAGTSITITPGQRAASPIPGQDPYQAALSPGESGNQPNIVNSHGFAGLYQIGPQAASDIRKAAPQLNLPEDYKSWTVEQQNAAEPVFRNLNASRFQQLGIPATPATLALAHAIGADGAAKLLSTPPNTPMEQAVPPEWISANANMRGKTVGDYVNGFARFNQTAGPQQAQGAPNGTPNPQLQGDTGPQTVQTPSQLSQPPTVPRPQLSPERQQHYRSAVISGAMTGEQADQASQKEIHDQWQLDNQRAMAIWQDQQQSKRLNEGADIKLRQEGPMTMIKDRVSNYETKIRPGAMAAVNDIASINQVRQVLDAGAFTGTGAEAKTFAAKVGEQLGIPSDQAQNTQVLGSVLAKRTLAAAGGTLGTGFSNADRDFMDRAAAGSVSIDEGAMRRVLDISEKQARQVIKNHDVEAGRVMKLPGVAQLGGEQFQVPQAPTYDEFNKANPLAPLQTSPQGQVAPQMQLPKVSSPDEALKLGSGKKFLLPDGRVGTVP